MSAETYDGPREYEAFSEFAKEHISAPICSVYRVENCSDEAKKIIDGLESKSQEELEVLVAGAEEKVKEEEEKFDAEVSKIQVRYDAMVEAFNLNLEEIKGKYNYKFVEQIMTIRQVAADEMSGADGEEFVADEL
jgi:F0F1-type ATP synthase membrane subunit b/b'